MMDSFSDQTLRALVPEQLVHYVRSVSTCTPMRVQDFLAWRAGSALVLAGYPKETADIFQGTDDPSPRVLAAVSQLDAAVHEALQLPFVETLSVLAPRRPIIPAGCTMTVHEDMYQGLALPVSGLSCKVTNMLRRAARECSIEFPSAWGPDHDALLTASLARMCARTGDRQLSSDAASLFRQLPALVHDNPGKIVLYSARRKDTGALAGLVVGDHASYTTSFYLFALKGPDAPPGTADALLSAFLAHSQELGQVRSNLGLAINEGIRFFKAKWGAKPWFPLVECTITKPAKGFFARLFGRR